jgi:preprotein translocase subunit Sec61beta
MADSNFRIPMGSGGLVRYDDESRSKLRIKPEYVIALIVLTVIFELILKVVGKA